MHRGEQTFANLGLWYFCATSRQSKLSQEQLLELQKSTHFDKKELQQWYKGMSQQFMPRRASRKRIDPFHPAFELFAGSTHAQSLLQFCLGAWHLAN